MKARNSFYIDFDKAEKLGLLGKIRVTLNGKLVHRCESAKHGANGFVEYNLGRLNRSKTDLVRRKQRGDVKISINKVKVN